jgi:hypothetical protein
MRFSDKLFAIISYFYHLNYCQWRTQETFSRGWGVQQIQLRTGGRENEDLGAVAPSSGVPLNLQMSQTGILIRLLRIYFPRNWEFGSALSKLRNFVGRGGLNPPKSHLGMPLFTAPFLTNSLLCNIRYLISDTNKMHAYLLHMYTMFLPHVSVCFTQPSGKSDVFLTQNHSLTYIYDLSTY